MWPPRRGGSELLVRYSALFGSALILGVTDVVQHRRSILRNHPILGHMRFAFEATRPEVQQYEWLAPGALLAGEPPVSWAAADLRRASPGKFAPLT